MDGKEPITPGVTFLVKRKDQGRLEPLEGSARLFCHGNDRAGGEPCYATLEEEGWRPAFHEYPRRAQGLQQPLSQTLRTRDEISSGNFVIFRRKITEVEKCPPYAGRDGLGPGHGARHFPPRGGA